MSTIWMFDDIGNKHNFHRDKDCKIKFCEFLREHEMKIINFEKKKMIPLLSKGYEYILIKQIIIFEKKSLKINKPTIKMNGNFGNIFILQKNAEVLHTAYVI